MFKKPFLTIKNIGLVFIACLVFLGVLITSSALYINHNINKVEKSWSLLKKQKSERAYILNNIYSGIGYGGMIHNFKNYIIRGEQADWNKTHVSFGKVKSLISHYNSLPLSKNDTDLLKPISSMIRDYEQALHKVAKLKKAGNSIKGIDAEVTINDSGKEL